MPATAIVSLQYNLFRRSEHIYLVDHIIILLSPQNKIYNFFQFKISEMNLIPDR